MILSWHRETGSSTLFVDGGDEKRVQFVHRVILGHLAPNTTYSN